MTESSPTAAFRRPDYGFAMLVTLIFALTLFPRIYLHIPWRDELHSWTLASDGCGLPEMFSRIRYEGHPSLWYVLIWFGCRIWNEVLVMGLMHGLIASGSVFLIAAFAPAMRWQRVLLCGGYFFLFEHAVLARNYAPSVLALLGFSIVMTRAPRAYLLAGLLLAVAINFNVMAALLAVALSLWTAAQWLREGRPVPIRFALGVGIVVVGFGIAFLQMRSPPDRQWADTVLDFDPIRAGKMAAAMYRSFVPIPSPARDWWGTNLLDFQPVTNKLNAIQGLLGIAVFFVAGWLLPGRRHVRALWFIGTTILLAFGYFKYVGSLRHHSHFFILFIVAWWLGHAGSEVTEKKSIGKRVVFASILIGQLVAGLFASVADMVLPFTANRAAAQYINQNFPNAALIGYVDFTTAPIGQVDRRPMYYPKQAVWGTYCVWNMARIGPVFPEMFTDAARKLRQEEPKREVLLVLSDDAEMMPDPAEFKQVKRFDDSTVKSERYTLFVYDPR